jgi:hypothetical protein
MRKLLFLTFFSLVVNFLSQAQIVNIEDSRKKIDSTGLYGHIDLAFNLVQSSQQLLTFRGSSRVDVLRSKGVWMGILDYRVIHNDKKKLQDDGFFHLRYGRFFGKRLTWETFSQLQHNRQLRIDLRWLVGTGPRFLAYDKPKQKIYFGAMYMYEYDEVLASNTIWRDHRLSSYLSIHLQLLPQLNFASTSYFQPLISNFGDSRLSSVNSLNFRLSEHLKFRLQFNISYDARLANETENVPKTVYSFVNGIRWEF